MAMLAGRQAVPPATLLSTHFALNLQLKSLTPPAMSAPAAALYHQPCTLLLQTTYS